MKKLIASLLCAAMALTLAAAEKTGYVNMETVFNSYYKTVNENINFENQRKKFVDAMDIFRKEYKSSLQEYQKAKADAENELLSTEARSAAASRVKLLETRLQQKQDEIMDFRDNGMREIESKQQTVTNALAEDLLAQTRNFAAQKGYTLVLEVSGKSLSRIPVVITYPKEAEFTEELIQVINAGHEKEKADAQTRLDALRKQAEEEAKAAQAQAAQQ